MATIAGVSWYLGVGGVRIFVRSWRPAVGDPRATLVIVHGFNAHSGHYDDVGRRFADAGLVVYALDLRGRGRSEGERFYVDTFQDYADDVATLMDEVRNEEGALPIYVMGHSAGAVIACLYALEHQRDIAGLITESIAFEIPAADVVAAVLEGVSHLAPHAHRLELQKADFSRDPSWLALLNTDPLVAGEVQPARTVAEMVRADDRLRRDFALIRTPLLILHGGQDRAARPSGSQKFFDSAGSPDKTLKLYGGAYHDLLHDIDREIVMGDIVQWLHERIPQAQAITTEVLN